MKDIGIKLGTLGLLATLIIAPMSANADAHRQDNRTELRNVVVNVFRPAAGCGNDRNREHDANWRRDDRNDRDQHHGERGNDGRTTRR